MDEVFLPERRLKEKNILRLSEKRAIPAQCFEKIFMEEE